MVLLGKLFQTSFFPQFLKPFIYDSNPLKSFNNLESVHKCEFVFVCVPTPMHEDGSQDLSFIYDVFKKMLKITYLRIKINCFTWSY